MTMQHPELGINRTGMSTAGDLSEEMVAGTKEFPPRSAGDEREIAMVRADYAKDAEPLGSVPPPLTLKGVLKTAAKGLKGEHPTLFVDKLAERLAFERTGVRLYEALVSKHDAYGSYDGGPVRSDLEHIMLQELDHYRMLDEAITRLGGDPTVLTPSGDLQATMGRGILDVIVDPRTNLMQSLEAILLAELADNECWKALVQLTEIADEKDLAVRFRQAELEEQEHLVRVRAWLAAAQDRPALGIAESTLTGA